MLKPRGGGGILKFSKQLEKFARAQVFLVHGLVARASNATIAYFIVEKPRLNTKEYD